MEYTINPEIVDYERQKFVEINYINKLHDLKNQKGHINTDILNHINNINLNDSDIELKQLYINLLPMEKIKRKLLKYELKYYNDVPTIMTIKEFTTKGMYYLSRYTKKAGGFYFDDNLWITVNGGNNNDTIKFVNTICKYHYKKDKTLMFIHNIVSKLRQLVSNITVTWNAKKKNGLVKIIIMGKLN